MGGARADFVGSLGKRVAELARGVAELERAPESRALREGLKRRLQMLITGAKLLGFGAVADALATALRRLDAPDADSDALAATLRAVPDLAWLPHDATGTTEVDDTARYAAPEEPVAAAPIEPTLPMGADFTDESDVTDPALPPVSSVDQGALLHQARRALVSAAERDDVAGGDRGRPGRARTDEVRLEGRHAIVAEDDSAVRWFLADLLRAAGMTVSEAVTGSEALAAARLRLPDVILADCVMPEVDGFELYHRVQRDVLLRETPFVLLSWRDDMLRRARDLGVRAHAFVRKESDPRVVITRVREALYARDALERRLATGGTVHGRLDDVTPATVLRTCSAVKPDCAVEFLDACAIYEVVLRDGAVRSIRFTPAMGAPRAGEAAFAALLGIAGGTFVAKDPLLAKLPLEEWEPPAPPDDAWCNVVERIRRAADDWSGAAIVRGHSVPVDGAMAELYASACPEAVRRVVRRLCEGVSPRALLAEGISPSLLEDVLGDLANRGALLDDAAPAEDPLLLSLPIDLDGFAEAAFEESLRTMRDPSPPSMPSMLGAE
jgi:CheY-like chemotaxis protein